MGRSEAEGDGADPSSSDRREKDRTRDRDIRDRDRERDRDRDRDRDRERRDRDRDKERRDRDKYRDKDEHDGGEKNYDAQKEKRRKDRDRDRDRDRADEERDRSKKERDKDWDKEQDKSSKERVKTESEARDKEKKKSGDDEKLKSHVEADNAQLSAFELEDRISRLRSERLKSTDKKPTKNEANEEEDIAAWVQKSRKIEEQKVTETAKIACMAKALVEPDEDDEIDDEETDNYSAANLAGMKIRHGIDKVLEGGAVILTLKDSNILAGDDINEELDELENFEIATQKARDDAYKAAKKKTGLYDDKFSNDGIEEKAILPQYDDPSEKSEVAVLNESGGIDEQSLKKMEEVRRRMSGLKSLEDTLLGATKVASDFYTQEEMLKFNKPKKKKKLRKKDTLDINALEAEAKASGLGSEDLGSRASGSRTASKQREEMEEEERRKSAYINALAKAVESSKALRQDKSVEEIAGDFGADDDEELRRSIERARKAALKKKTENGVAMSGPHAVVELVFNSKREPTEGTSIANNEGEKPVVFTDTEEFCLSLQLDEAISRRAGDKDVFAEEDEAAPLIENEKLVKDSEGGWMEVNEDDMAPQTAETEKDNQLGDEEPIQEVSVGKGLAGALHLLKERGALKETVDWGGRNMDKKRSKLVGIVDEDGNQPQRDILLDRVDEFGRTMTPKESFRKLSHKFHGKGPGKAKQEKKMKQYQEDMKLKQMNSGDTPLMSMEKIREAQARMHTPYIVISGHIKPGQTSDPRSGFATVEKEPIGSLTPMLGDKKVEHFLGIKRKPESGSMGPPPPKKPKQ